MTKKRYESMSDELVVKECQGADNAALVAVNHGIFRYTGNHRVSASCKHDSAVALPGRLRMDRMELLRWNISRRPWVLKMATTRGLLPKISLRWRFPEDYEIGEAISSR